MKRLGNIFLSLTLSMIIIALGAGVGVVYCSHSGTTTLALASTQELCGETPMDTECCARQNTVRIKAPGCMSVKVLKLDAATLHHPSTPDFHPMPMLVADYLLPVWRLLPAGFPTAAKANRWGSGFRSPPRTYLRKLRVLRL